MDIGGPDHVVGGACSFEHVSEPRLARLGELQVQRRLPQVGIDQDDALTGVCRRAGQVSGHGCLAVPSLRARDHERMPLLERPLPAKIARRRRRNASSPDEPPLNADRPFSARTFGTLARIGALAAASRSTSPCSRG